MEIAILRHGKPDVPTFGRVTACEMCQYIEAYNSAGIGPNEPPPARVVDVAHTCRAVVSSDLPRSLQTAAAVRVNQPCFSEAIFREADLPYGNWRSPRLPPKAWTALFRVLWVLGYSSNAESFRSVKMRAAAGGERLRQYAAEHGTVLFVGHGLINHFIAGDLLAKGWHGPSNPGKGYWDFGVYTCPEQGDVVLKGMNDEET